MKFSTFHAFMLADAKVGGAVTEGPGFNTSPAKAIADELELIEYADELGYDTCWVREHHFTQYGFLPNTMSLLAHAAARTNATAKTRGRADAAAAHDASEGRSSAAEARAAAQSGHDAVA